MKNWERYRTEKSEQMWRLPWPNILWIKLYMSFIYIFYKCNDGKMVISENNHASTKLDTAETDTTTTISKATETMVNSNTNYPEVHVTTRPWTSNITTNKTTLIYQKANCKPCLIIESNFWLKVTNYNTTVICYTCSNIHVLNEEQWNHYS